MKKGLIAVAVLIALGVVAQKGKTRPDVNTEDVEVVNPNNPKPGKNLDKGEIKMTDGVTSAKPKTNGSSKGSALDEVPKTAKEFGQKRAEEARAKYSEPSNEKEAKAMVSEIKTNVKNQVEVIDTKIVSATELVEQKHDLGGMTDLEYELAMAKIDAFKVRRKAINARLK